MDGGSSSLPLSSPPPQVYLRRPVPPPDPAHPPKVHFYRSPAPIPIFSARAPCQRNSSRPPMPPPPAPHAVPASQAPPRPPPPAPAPAASTEQLPPRPPLPPHAMLPPRPPQPPPGAGAMPPPPAPQPVAKGLEKATPPSNDENTGRENSRAEVKKEGTEQGHDKSNATAPVKVIKRPKKAQASKRTLDGSDTFGTTEGDAGTSFPSNPCRYDSSLSLLTKKFISLLKEAEDGTIDLNKAAEALEVQKRRIYDITNVLEGVDLIEKTLKNMIRWKGFDMSKPKERELQVSAMKEELESLYAEDDRLEDEIREVQEKLQALALDQDKRKFLYVLKEDINKLPRFQGSTLIAINAPHGTSVEVPDPDADIYLYRDLGLKEKHYQIILRSSMGPIDCYLISDRQEVFNPDHEVSNNSKPVVATGSAQAVQHMDCVPNQSVQQMDCDPNEAVQRMHCDPSRAPKKGESNAACTHTAEPSRRHESTAGLLRIVPSDGDADADYWFASDPDVSVTDAWGS